MTTTTTTRTLKLSISQRIAIGLSCLFLGTSIVYAVGLMQNENMHNAAHDTRHGLGFPCH
jgi:cobalt transporter subunit CbtB